MWKRAATKAATRLAAVLGWCTSWTPVRFQLLDEQNITSTMSVFPIEALTSLFSHERYGYLTQGELLQAKGFMAIIFKSSPT